MPELKLLMLLKQTEEEGEVTAFWQAKDKDELLKVLEKEHPNPFIREEITKFDVANLMPVTNLNYGQDRYCLLKVYA